MDNSSASPKKKFRLNWYVVASIGALLFVVSAAVIGYLLSDYEVIEKGVLFSYSKGTIYKIRFRDSITLYLQPEIRPSFDLLNVYILTGVAFSALTFSALIKLLSAGKNVEVFWFFLIIFLGMSFLSADEMLGIHETLGHNMQFLTRLPLIKRPDDAIILSFSIPAALFLWRFYRILLTNRLALKHFGSAFCLFLVAAFADALSIPGEDLIEVAASVLILSGVFVLGVHQIRSLLFDDNLR